ncbi:DUF4376 domain-containing protein [Paremcibacter congregatus]|uniref:DUF4376 domain-containing protein n=1 Tax=Paremcibacter congregatus TaxID=2043170 RepID=UPI0030ED6DEA|tara:strand:+ start:1492 stop:2259 length:768 start_codon:yes stop_codon:yes gene_type:complete
MTLSIVFDVITREILDTPDVPETDTQAVNPDDPDIVRIPGTADIENDYIGFGDVVLPREVTSFFTDKNDLINDGVDTATLTLPDPCFLWINGNGVSQAVTGGSYSFSSTESGIYQLRLVGRYKADEITITVHDLTSLKNTIKKKVKKQYETVLYGGFIVEFNGVVYEFQSDETSMNLISGTAAVANRVGLPEGFIWKTSDNILLPFGVVEIQALEAAMFAHINQIFGIKETKIAALELLTDLDQIINFDIIGGWT